MLDLLNQKFNLQHLDVKPRNLFLVEQSCEGCGLRARQQPRADKLHAGLNAVTPLYASPEFSSAN